MQQESQFYKFPKTPHLVGSSTVDDDQILSKADLKAFASNCYVVIQEKVDGANVGVHFDREWEPVIQKRGGIIGSGEKPQYDVFRNWVYERMDLLWEIIGAQYCLFGEWLWCTHAVSYSTLPEYLIVFDLLEKSTGRYLSHKRLHQIVAGRLPIVPVLFEGPYSDDLVSKLPSLIKKSSFGSEQAEGIYLRFESPQYVLERAKFRRATFTAGRADFETSVKNNSLLKK